MPQNRLKCYSLHSSPPHHQNAVREPLNALHVEIPALFVLLTSFNIEDFCFLFNSCIFVQLKRFKFLFINFKFLKKMTKEELLEELNSMIDSEINITNLQSDDYNEDILKTLWYIKSMVEELEE